PLPPGRRALRAGAGVARGVPHRALLPVRARRPRAALPRGDPPRAVAAPPGRGAGRAEHDGPARARASGGEPAPPLRRAPGPRDLAARGGLALLAPCDPSARE